MKTKLNPSPYWVPISVLVAKLNRSPLAAHRASSKTIKRRRDEGVFKLGEHYRIVGAPNAIRPDYLYHLPKCAEALGIPLE